MLVYLIQQLFMSCSPSKHLDMWPKWRLDHPAQADQFHSLHEETLHTWLYSLCECAGWSDSSLDTCHKICFLKLQLICFRTIVYHNGVIVKILEHFTFSNVINYYITLIVVEDILAFKLVNWRKNNNKKLLHRLHNFFMSEVLSVNVICI